MSLVVSFQDVVVLSYSNRKGLLIFWRIGSTVFMKRLAVQFCIFFRLSLMRPSTFNLNNSTTVYLILWQFWEAKYK